MISSRANLENVAYRATTQLELELKSWKSTYHIDKLNVRIPNELGHS